MWKEVESRKANKTRVEEIGITGGKERKEETSNRRSENDRKKMKMKT